jgi:hypothetical protein
MKLSDKQGAVIYFILSKNSRTSQGRWGMLTDRIGRLGGALLLSTAKNLPFVC